MYDVREHSCCNCKTKYVHDYRIKTIKHGYVNGYLIILKYKRRRYIRKKCNTKFPEYNSFVEKHHKKSKINKFLILHKLKYNHSFKYITSLLNIYQILLLG